MEYDINQKIGLRQEDIFKKTIYSLEYQNLSLKLALNPESIEDTTENRHIACMAPYTAYLYAKDVDKNSHANTRESACRDPWCAYLYAKDVDKVHRDGTRQAASKQAKAAFFYALHIDKCAKEDTRIAACKESNWAYYYALQIDKTPMFITRDASCQNPLYALLYALNVDKDYLGDTLLGVKNHKMYKRWYDMTFSSRTPKGWIYIGGCEEYDKNLPRTIINDDVYATKEGVNYCGTMHLYKSMSSVCLFDDYLRGLTVKSYEIKLRKSNKKNK